MLADLLFHSATVRGDHPALVFQGRTLTFGALAHDVRVVAKGLAELGAGAGDRVAILLDKQFECVAALLGAAASGAVFVPINPVLRAAQVAYVLQDCAVKILITTRSRLGGLAEILSRCPELRTVVVIGEDVSPVDRAAFAVESWAGLLARGARRADMPAPVADTAMAGILYTSGSTGEPKGVIHSHRNFVQDAIAVATALRYRDDDRILNLPPYSFGFGLNQIFSALHAGVTAVLHNFLTAADLMKTIAEERVTGVSAVPTVMMQLAAMEWPAQAVANLRYLSVSGGRFPELGVRQLRQRLPQAELYLMYGMTEGLTSTYLPPEEVDRRPASMGKPLPGVELAVVRPDGSLCQADEPGELVKIGAMVALGYWNDAAATAEKFRPAPGASPTDSKLALWSGDMVKRDADGLLYFVERQDAMIKTSGYRVSPTEVENAAMLSGAVTMAAAIGVPDAELGQAIVLFATPKAGARLDRQAIIDHCRSNIPAYMMPRRIIAVEALPVNANGKLDRRKLAADYEAAPAEPEAREQSASDAASSSGNFFQRWAREALQIIGVEKRAFRHAIDVFAWHFPDRVVGPSDSFSSLEGDSLSYVGISTGLQEVIGDLPDDWERMSIADLERRRGHGQPAVRLQPEIILRALAIVMVCVEHASIGTAWEQLSGSAIFLLLASGFSFARFQWSDSGLPVLRSILRFAGRIALPYWAMLLVVGLHRGEMYPSLFLFYGNMVEPWLFYWWLPAWFLSALFQIWLLMIVLAFIPGVARYGVTRRFTFGLMLVLGGMVVDTLTAQTVPTEDLRVALLTPYFVWVFAMGWLVAASQTSSEKTITFFVLLLALANAMFGHGLYNFVEIYNQTSALWLLVGTLSIMWLPPIALPRLLTRITILLAQAMLFIYLFHWPAAFFLRDVFHMTNRPLEFLIGSLMSVVAWIVWESMVRAWRVDGPTRQRQPA